MKSRRWVIAIAAVAVVLILGGIQVVRKTLRASIGYTVESRFARLPSDDDDRLTTWIQSQPGIVGHTVHVERVGGDGKTIRIFFIQSRNLAGDPPFPDLDGACDRLGYSSPVFKFRDSNVP